MMVSNLLKIQNQLKVYHWQTKGTGSYGQHKALDATYETFTGLIDEFLEVFMGKYGRIKGPFSLELNDFESVSTINKFIDESIDFLVDELTDKLDEKKDTDLLNIKDEMLSSLNKLKYLITLE